MRPVSAPERPTPIAISTDWPAAPGAQGNQGAAERHNRGSRNPPGHLPAGASGAGVYGSLFASSVEGPVKLTVSFRTRNNPDKILASTEVTVPDGGKWTRLPFRLKLPAGAVKSHELVDFAVSMTGAQRISLDMIRLFPTDAVEGFFDPEVIKAAKDMNYSMIRWGGNFMSAYHWEDGVGPRTSAPRCSIGLGAAWNTTISAPMNSCRCAGSRGAADDLHEPGERHQGRSPEMGGVRPGSAVDAAGSAPRGQRA